MGKWLGGIAGTVISAVTRPVPSEVALPCAKCKSDAKTEEFRVAD
jgi:hypothetical protein